MEPPAFGYGAYEPPASSGARPAVILWYRVFALTSIAAYVSVALIWQLLTPRHAGGTELHAWAPVLLFTAPFVLFNLVGALVPYRPWGWSFGVVTIAFGMLTCMFPFSIALIIFWSRPEVKAAFRRI